MKTELVNLCPHCGWPGMREAPTSASAKGATVKCEYHGCKNEASFIQDRRALCFVHARLPGRK